MGGKSCASTSSLPMHRASKCGDNSPISEAKGGGEGGGDTTSL